MASKKQQFVTAPLVIAKDAAGRDVYLYQGAPLPESLAKGEADRLADFLGSDQEVVPGDATQPRAADGSDSKAK